MERVENLRTENKFKKTEIGKIPVDWEVVKVQDVCEKAEYGYTESAIEKLVGPKFLRISDIQNRNVNWESVPFCHCPNLIREKYLLKPGDILFARTGATTGKSYIIKRCPEAVFASYLIRIVTKERINSYFLYLVFNSFFYWKQIKEQIGGSAQGGVNASSLSNIKVPLPPLPEQKKIAEILLSVDEAIDKKQEIIEKAKMLKKGLMQELLTHGIGHTKFKKTEIGEIPLDWDVMKLGNISELKGRIGWRGYTKEDLRETGPLVIGATQISPNNKITLENPVYISMKKFLESPEIHIEKNMILIVKTGNTIGKVALVENDQGKACINPNVGLIKDIKINPKYLYYFMTTHHFQSMLWKKVIVGAQPSINQQTIKKMFIPIPSKEEQKKIAEILTSVDEEIEKEMAQKERIENIKKGLMQVLLTGKIRVKI